MASASISSANEPTKDLILVYTVGMAKCFSKSMETREELSTTCDPKVMSTNMVSVVRIQVFSIINR